MLSLPGVIPQLNYATLDLSISGSEDRVQTSLSPRSSVGSQASPLLSSQTSPQPISYAEIDFEKSDEMKVSKAVRDDRVVLNVHGLSLERNISESPSSPGKGDTP